MLWAFEDLKFLARTFDECAAVGEGRNQNHLKDVADTRLDRFCSCSCLTRIPCIVRPAGKRTSMGWPRRQRSNTDKDAGFSLVCFHSSFTSMFSLCNLHILHFIVFILFYIQLMPWFCMYDSGWAPETAQKCSMKSCAAWDLMGLQIANSFTLGTISGVNTRKPPFQQFEEP